ncbi:MAG: potassium channel family protein [Syntrophorhabdales bacterium]
MLPRRVRHRFRFARLFYRSTWVLWSLPARAFFSGGPLESVLGFYGPLSLLLLIFIWAVAIMFGFALIHFSLGSALAGSGESGFLSDLYMSGTTFFTLGLGDVRPVTAAARIVTVVEAGTGFGFLALVIAYLPALNQSFSRREAGISMLDARAGSPPTAMRVFQKHAHENCKEELRELLSQWERWSAELLESHLSYPVLAYYRSQHDNQSWLAALTVILDTSAVIIAGIAGEWTRQAELTFAMARHAVVDLAVVFNRPPKNPGRDRLGDGGFMKLRSVIEAAGLELADPRESERRLEFLRGLYEPYIEALRRHFYIEAPPWIPEAWQAADWEKSPWEQTSSAAVSVTEDEWRDHHFRKGEKRDK